jgi:hypothetical protein
MWAWNKNIGETGNLARGLTKMETLVGPQHPLSKATLVLKISHESRKKSRVFHVTTS